MKQIVAIFVVIAIGGSASAQGAGQYAPTVKAFLQRLGMPDDIESFEYSLDGRRVDARSRNFSVTVEPATGEIVYWFDGRTGINPQSDQGGGRKITGNEEAIAAARKWLVKAGIEPPPVEKCDVRQAEGVSYGYAVKFSDRPHGYAPMVGNFINIEINAFSGAVSVMLRALGYTYEEPLVAITPEQALARLVSRAQGYYGLPIEDGTVGELGYATPDAGELCEVAVPERGTNKHARLAYFVSATMRDGVRRHQIFAQVDARTGDVMSGGVAKGTILDNEGDKTEPVKQKPMAAKTKGAPPLAFIVPAVAVVLLGVFLAFRAYRAR